MDENILKKCQKLESENEMLRQKLDVLARTRSPLNPLPVPKSPKPAEPSASNVEAFDDNLLFYLKSVLGYSIKYDHNKITLRSVYAFSSEDVFEIEVQNSKLVLKSTDYLNEWSEYFNIYIKNGRSYCAFFAAVTLELFNRKTFG